MKGSPVSRASRARPWLAAGLAATGALVAFVALAALVAWLNLGGEAPVSGAPPTPPAPEAVARGAVLAALGNCSGCHTAPGGAPYAGGRAIVTPFGSIHAGNLTPDAETGLGGWNADHFWRALHHGRSRDGRLLNPAFPYPSFTRMTRADSDALFAYLQSEPPVRQVQPAQALRWPYGTQPALAVWRALYFRPAAFEPDPARTAGWNRGAYLVQGLAHCGACHAPRNALGAAQAGSALSGATMPDGLWHAPALPAGWPAADIAALLLDGRSPSGSALGPMALVVAGSTQHWPAADAQAVGEYLAALSPRSAPQSPLPKRTPVEAADPDTLRTGEALYGTHCAECHGKAREGAPGAWPALDGHRTVLAMPANNLIRAILEGGFGAATAAHPRPYGMPPFGHQLNDVEIAALATWLRQAGAEKAEAVLPLEVRQVR